MLSGNSRVFNKEARSSCLWAGPTEQELSARTKPYLFIWTISVSGFDATVGISHTIKNLFTIALQKPHVGSVVGREWITSERQTGEKTLEVSNPYGGCRTQSPKMNGKHHAMRSYNY